MEQLIKYIIGELTGQPDNNNIDISIDNDVIKVVVNKEDMGRVIGKQGKIARAIRTIIKAVGMKQGTRYSLEITERE